MLEVSLQPGVNEKEPRKEYSMLVGKEMEMYQIQGEKVQAR